MHHPISRGVFAPTLAAVGSVALLHQSFIVLFFIQLLFSLARMTVMVVCDHSRCVLFCICPPPSVGRSSRNRPVCRMCMSLCGVPCLFCISNYFVRLTLHVWPATRLPVNIQTFCTPSNSLNFAQPSDDCSFPIHFHLRPPNSSYTKRIFIT